MNHDRAVSVRFGAKREGQFRHDCAVGFDEEFGGGLGTGVHFFDGVFLLQVSFLIAITFYSANDAHSSAPALRISKIMGFTKYINNI